MIHDVNAKQKNTFQNFVILKVKAAQKRSAAVRTAERGGRRGHCPGARGHRGTRGSELSGLECKIHQLKLRPAGAMMLFFDFGPKFEHPRTL